MIKVREFYKKFAARMEVAAHLSLHFSGGKYVIWEKQRKSFTPFNRFSSSFHQNDRNASGHLILETDDLEIIGRGQNL